MGNINIVVVFLPILCATFLGILLYPSKATYLLAFTIPLSPYFALFKSDYATYGYVPFNLNDLIVSGLLLSLFLNFCLRKKSLTKYPLLMTNFAILALYFCLLVITGLVRPINEFVFQLFYLLRYTLYFIIGFYVWEYLSVKDIEKYILILLSGLFINSVYAIYTFVESVFHGKYLSFGLVPRVSGFWGIILGAEGYNPEIGDPGNFAMYLLISLIVNILYLFYKMPRPKGFKKKIAITSLFFGFIALHITMSRTVIYAFWGACLFLLIFEGKMYFKRKIILSFSVISLVGISVIYYIGIDLVGFLVERLYFETSAELTTGGQGGRFRLTADLIRYLLNEPLHWWGHGISSDRLYMDALAESGIIPDLHTIHTGYLNLFWDGGLIGVFIWVLWIKRHFVILSIIKKKVAKIAWLSVSLKGILIGVLIAMISTGIVHNFRLMGYFSFLIGLLLKHVHQNYSLKDCSIIQTSDER